METVLMNWILSYILNRRDYQVPLYLDCPFNTFSWL